MIHEYLIIERKINIVQLRIKIQPVTHPSTPNLITTSIQNSTTPPKFQLLRDICNLTIIIIKMVFYCKKLRATKIKRKGRRLGLKWRSPGKKRPIFQTELSATSIFVSLETEWNSLWRHGATARRALDFCSSETALPPLTLRRCFSLLAKDFLISSLLIFFPLSLPLILTSSNSVLFTCKYSTLSIFLQLHSPSPCF